MPATARPMVDLARCTGCGWCVGACPPHVLSLTTQAGEKSATLHDAPGCTGCARCAVVCPFGAIRMARGLKCGQIAPDELSVSQALDPG